ncbi:MAG TPA: helix-turn-helix domain-containing protein [Microbacteriaceae bacterium]|nr:helix-turn-helix domain-containing protein [Microbacteriaceae bacterium]
MTSEVSHLTTKEVAKRFRVDPSTVRRWADSGSVPATKTPGGRYRFDAADIDALLTSPAEKAS